MSGDVVFSAVIHDPIAIEEKLEVDEDGRVVLELGEEFSGDLVDVAACLSPSAND